MPVVSTLGRLKQENSLRPTWAKKKRKEGKERRRERRNQKRKRN
jgi:hypothetical protein